MNTFRQARAGDVGGDGLQLMEGNTSAVEPIIRKAIAEESNRRMVALIFLNVTRQDLGPDTKAITDEELVAGIITAYKTEEQTLKQLKPRYDKVVPEAQEALRFAAAEYGVAAPDFSRFQLSYGFWHYLTFSMADCLAQGKPLAYMTTSLSCRGQYSPPTDLALVRLDEKPESETNQPWNVRKVYIHEGLHQMGHEIRDAGGQVVVKGIGRSGVRHNYDRGLLEEGLISILAKQHDARYTPPSTTDTYPKEVALITWMTQAGISMSTFTKAHFNGETTALERRIDDVFGDGLISFLTGMRSGEEPSGRMGYDPFIRQLPTAQPCEVRAFMRIIQGRPLEALASSPEVSDQRLEGLLASYYRYLYLEAVPLNRPRQDRVELDAALYRLPDSLAQKIRSIPGEGWSLYKGDAKEEAEKAFQQAAREAIKRAKERKE